MIDEMFLSGLMKFGFGLLILLAGMVIGYVLGSLQPYIFDGDTDEFDEDEYYENRPEDLEEMPRPKNRG